MQTISNSIQIAHQLLKAVLQRGGVFVDATMGNGFDTSFMVREAAEGSVIYAFDIQDRAVEQTRGLLAEEAASAYDNKEVKLICDNHINMYKYIDAPIDAAIFNLGYLPNGEKSITTKTETTVAAIEWILAKLKVNGTAAIVLYPGHEAGKEEYAAVEKLGMNLPKKYYTVGWYKMVNHNFNAPTLCWIEKVGDLNEGNKTCTN